jgi:multimeric flavodoxin WrbA
MKVMTLLGSPRKHGNTAQVLGYVEDSLKAGGHEVDHCWMNDYAVAGCQECNHCKAGKVELCTVYDDGIGLLKKIIEADVVVFAAPVFCWGFPGPMKTLLDRMYCLADAESSSRIEGKPIALIVTAGGPEKDNADLLVKAYESMTAYMGAVTAGALVIANCSGPESIDTAVQTRASAFAEMLAAFASGKHV